MTTPPAIHAEPASAKNTLSSKTTGHAPTPADRNAAGGSFKPRPQPVAGTVEIMAHLAAHGCPPVPAEPREPTPFECHAFLLYEKRRLLGDSGERLGREMDMRECQNVGHGGAYHRRLIAARWDVMRRAAEDTAGDKYAVEKHGDRFGPT